MFEENEIGVSDFPLLAEDHLRELGLLMGPRMRLLAAAKGDSPSEDLDAPSSEAESPHAYDTRGSLETYRGSQNQGVRWKYSVCLYQIIHKIFCGKIFLKYLPQIV